MNIARAVVIIVGAVILALGLLADVIGLGPTPGFGWKQIVLIIAGSLILGFAIGAGRGAKPSAGGASPSSPPGPPAEEK